MRRSGIAAALIAAVTLALAGCAGAPAGAGVGKMEKSPAYRLVIEGFEWGPSVTKVVLDFGAPARADSVSASTFTVRAGGAARTVTAAYVSDPGGNRVDGADGAFVTIEMATGYDEAAGPIDNSSPFIYDLTISRNVWAPLDVYQIATAPGQTVVVDGVKTVVNVPPGNYAGKIAPATDDLKKGSYTYRGSGGGVGVGMEKINTAAFEPEALRADAGANPLIIWLHGAGGGSADDIDIALYDNDVTEIMGPAIQRHFQTGGLAGAYVLYPQCATWWMDNGAGEMTARGPESRYTEALKATIDDYLASNSDVDRSRVYLGGCSNGGYMTVNMLTHYPGFFAAAYPICEAFASAEITDAALADMAREAIWFVVSADDPVVAPVSDFTLDTYVRLIRAGADNAHLSYYENVIGVDAPGVRYVGHFSWIYALQDRTSADQDAAAVKAGGVDALSTSSAVPVLVDGRPAGLWAWLAAQRL